MAIDAAASGLHLVQAGLDALRAESAADLPAIVLGEQLATIETLIARLRHEQARRAAAFESAGGALADGFPTTASWLRANTMASPGEARDLVAVGRALRDRLPASSAVLASGGMSFTAATAITRALREVRDPEVLRQAEGALAALAPTLYPSQIAYAARRVLEHLDPQLAQRDAAQRWADRTLSLAPMLDGSIAVSGQLDEVSGAVLLSALTPMMTPRGPEDVRTTGQRRVDALVELVGKAAEIGAAGTMTSTGLPPTLLVKVDIERLRDVLGYDSDERSRPPLDPHSRPFDPHNQGGPQCPSTPLKPSDPQNQGGPQYLGGPLGSCPDGPKRPPLAELDWGGPILDETLRRIGCGAQLVRIVTAGPDRVLNLGRSRRLASPAQNLARMARDGGCLFTGCDKPPEWTEAHHENPWALGGGTDLDDLLSFCRFHHHLFHEGGWTLQRTPGGHRDRQPERPGAWADPRNGGDRLMGWGATTARQPQPGQPGQPGQPTESAAASRAEPAR